MLQQCTEEQVTSHSPCRSDQMMKQQQPQNTTKLGSHKKASVLKLLSTHLRKEQTCCLHPCGKLNPYSPQSSLDHSLTPQL